MAPTRAYARDDKSLALRRALGRPSSRRHRVPLQFWLPSNNQSYNHINVQPAAEQDRPAPHPAAAEFVIRPSVQEAISDDLVYARMLSSASSRSDATPTHRPATFAEAAMSTRVHTTMDGSTRKDNGNLKSLMTSNQPDSLGGLGPTKRRKKWSTLDWSASSEAVDHNTHVEGLAHRVSSSTTNFLQTHTSSPNRLNQRYQEFDSRSRAGAIPESSIIGPSTQPATAEPTLSEATLPDPTADGYSTDDDQPHDGSHLIGIPGIDLSGNPEIRENFNSVMAHLNQYVSPASTGSGRDSFNAAAWDPDLPRASPSVSNPAASIVPKPKPAVSYTTVGSVVNPDNVPQFSAPNRIQRDGAGRRPLMAMNERQYESLLQPRSVPSFGMQSPMPYTSHLLQIPPTYDNPTPRPSIRAGNQVPPNEQQMKGHEKDTLGRLHDTIQQMPPDSRKGPSATPSTVSMGSGSMQTRRPEMTLSEEELKRGYGTGGSRQGLEKMQTLQRLARFENPNRQHALSRLSQFSVANSNTRAASGSNIAGTNVDAFNSSQQQTMGSINQTDLGRDFRLQQSGLTSSSSSTPTMNNPLPLGSRSLAYPSPAPHNRPPGYPKPLTAGPPGQRQANQAFLSGRLQNSDNGGFAINRHSSGFNPHPNNHSYTQSSSVRFERNALAHAHNEAPGLGRNQLGGNLAHSYHDPFHQAPRTNRLQLLQKGDHPAPDAPVIAPSQVGPHTYLYDTIPADMMAKYYPNGGPVGKGYCKPEGTTSDLKDSSIEPPSPPLDKKSQRKKELDDFFYYGQRRYAMTAEEHIVELEHRMANPFGTIGSTRNKDVVPKALTPEEVENMTVAEAAKPALDGLFGTLLSYAEDTNNSRTKLSGWAKTPGPLIDDTPEGNKSCFGEDWGRK